MNQDSEAEIGSPSGFMRSIRPEKYSDSFVEEVTTLDRQMLEYHLETLTSRSQHLDFEGFARQLLRVEICPNITGQTGPSGGGDSKVDSETYPVAEDLTWNWIAGTDGTSAKERWAFAFSAKKEYRSKLQSDIKKIAETNRGYKKAFFVTNQFVPDRKKSELEDLLSEKYEIDVRILDRTWILDRVFENSRQELAITELGVSATIQKAKRLGPRDYRRKQQLEEIEQRIDQSIESGEIPATLIDDLSLAATISRALELPRDETAGRIARLRRYANEFGTSHQKIRSIYDEMWTNVFWFDDPLANLELYPQLEKLVSESDTAYDWELLVSQWQVLSTSTDDIDLLARYAKDLLAGLGRLSSDDSLRSNALHARSLQLSMELSMSEGKQVELDRVFQAYREIAGDAARLIGFPLDSMVNCLSAVSGLASKSAEFNLLHAEMVELVSQRHGEVAGARLLIERGKRQLDSNLYADAIRSFGTAFGKLYKNETQDLLSYSLYLCGCAYEKLGLLWAARGSILWAISISFGETWKRKEVSPFVVGCVVNLKWIELRLGRLPEVIAWERFLQTVRMAVGKDKSQAIESAENFHNFDAVLAILLLKTDLWELKHLEKLPAYLDALSLSVSCDSLLYALGQPSEFQTLLNEKGDDVQAMFLALRDQPASKDMPTTPSLCNTATGTLRSKILGCVVEVTFPNVEPFTDVAESLLAALESAFATGITDRFFSSEPSLLLEIRKVHFGELVSFEFVESACLHCVIKCTGFEIGAVSSDEHEQIRKVICNLILEFGLRALMIDEGQLHDLFGRDLALQRAATFSCSMQASLQTIGIDRDERGWSWAKESEYATHKCIRTKKWDADTPATSEPSRKFKLGKNLPDAMEDEIGRRPGGSHDSMEMTTLVRPSLWAAANWVATCFVGLPDHPPIIGLVFENKSAATKIFESWQQELSSVDKDELLRLTILRGVSNENPAHYRIVVGTNVDNYEFGQTPSSIISPCRAHTMEATTEQNLLGFLEAYETFGCYGVLMAMSNGDEFPTLLEMQPILKQQLNVKHAWEVGLGDLDAAGILPSDDVIVPDEIENPPIHKLTAWLKASQRDQLK